MLCIIETRPVFGYGLSQKDNTTKKLVNVKTCDTRLSNIVSMDEKTGYLVYKNWTEKSSYGKIKYESRIYPIHPNHKLTWKPIVLNKPIIDLSQSRW
jgi:hypothetical protein